jgi:hypothetical protein
MKGSGTDMFYVLLKHFPAVSEQSVNFDKGSLFASRMSKQKFGGAEIHSINILTQK